MNELLKKSAAEQSKAIKNKEISAVELTNAAFDRIEELDGKLGAFNSLTKDIALNTAKKVDEKSSIIPREFSKDGYKLFRELSDIVHGESNEKEGITKFERAKLPSRPAIIPKQAIFIACREMIFPICVEVVPIVRNCP